MGEAIASVPHRDDLSSTANRVSGGVGINDLERLALRYKEQNPSLSEEEAKNQALQQMLSDARNGTPSVSELANARQPQESGYRRGVPSMPIRGTINHNSVGPQRTSHAPSPSKPINHPSRQVGYLPYPTVIQRPSVSNPPAWNQSQFPQNLANMDYVFSTFGSSERNTYPPRMPQQPAGMLSTFPTSDTRSYGVGTARPRPNDLRLRQPNEIQGITRRINPAISNAKSESIENWINTDIPNELEKTNLPPSPPPSTSTERSIVELTISGNEAANSSPHKLSLQSPSQASPTQQTTETQQEPVQKPKRRRQRPREPVKCEVDNCNRSFSSPHELRRHHKREHDNEKWVIVDITPDKRLRGCKRCDNGHIYGAKYNATAHLKRKHVNLRKRKEGQKELDCPHPDKEPKEFTQYANRFVQPKKAVYSEDSDSEDGNVSDCVEKFDRRMQGQQAANGLVGANKAPVDDYMDYPVDSFYSNSATPQFVTQQATFINQNHYTQFMRKQGQGALLEEYTTGSGSYAIPPNTDVFSAFGVANNQALGQSLTMPTAMPDFGSSGGGIDLQATGYNNGGANSGTAADTEEFFDFGRTLIENFSNTGFLADVDLAMMEQSTFLDNLLF